MGPEQFIERFVETVSGWKFDRASIGFPVPIRNGRITRDPKHLGNGWIGFNFGRALGIPVRLINDAAMQALGSYRARGRMLFLGLGTGLGSALVWERTLMPLELGDLPYRHGKIIENCLGIPGLELLGQKKWKREVLYAVMQLKKSFIADYVVLGGGLVHRFSRLPRGIERGQNENARRPHRTAGAASRDNPARPRGHYGRRQVCFPRADNADAAHVREHDERRA